MNIEYLQGELNILEHYGEDRKSLDIKYIQKRLAKSTQTYYNNMKESVEHLSKQDDLRLIRYLKK